ncbi:hypothetical protein DFJ74DRAFT_766410 [Hyaloraphidium curvatum]|nr:hypothetical protein DFJ74DRAFT_766410 [Hyaloraphidium curvatum]
MEGDDYFAPVMRTNPVPDAEPTNGQDLAGLVAAHPWIAKWREPPRERLIDKLSAAALSPHNDNADSDGDPLSEEHGSADQASDSEGGRYCFSHQLPGMVNNRRLSGKPKKPAARPLAPKPVPHANEDRRKRGRKGDSDESEDSSYDSSDRGPQRRRRRPPQADGPVLRPCKFPGCPRSANYGPEGPGQLLRCSSHKLAGMVPKYRHCAADGCSNFPWFRTSWKSGYCRAHRRLGEPTRRPGSIDRYCDMHREDGMVVLTE